jgi:hypothetical protein
MATRVNYDLNVQYICSARCGFCNRGLDLFTIPNGAMTIDQVKIVIEKWRKAEIFIKKLKISGGEPSLHKDLVEIVQLLLDSGIVGTVWVLSNGIKKDLPKLPRGARWKVDPIVLSPKQGWKNHQPFLVSPDDYEIRSDNCGKTCSTVKHCGHGVEAFGFSQCGVAGFLGHLLGIDPYSEEPVLELDERLCKHCIYHIPDAEQKKLQRKCPTSRWPDGSVTHGEGIEHPSPTFKKALKQYREKPTTYARAFE